MVAEGCKLNMAKAIVSQTDIVELVPHDKGVPPKWLRGTVKKEQFQLVDDQGQTIDPQEIQRMWFSDRDGNVRVAVQGSGHKPSKLALSKIVITLDPGEQCPTGSNPCEVDSKEVRVSFSDGKGNSQSGRKCTRPNALTARRNVLRFQSCKSTVSVEQRTFSMSRANVQVG